MLSMLCVISGAGGCAALTEDEVTYNPYVRNEGRKPALRAADEALSTPEEALNEFDRRFERVTY